MKTYQHSVSLDESKCKGCTTCLKRCPTEAIRIREGHAVINSERCIDCGECIRQCPHKAKRALHDSLDSLSDFRYTIALPAPSLYGQFDNLDSVDTVISGLYALGFDDVYEVAKAAELVSAYTRIYLNRTDIVKPVISSACPVITRIISMNYPYLVDHVLPIQPPVEVAALAARQRALRAHPELGEADIGVYFISPCPAKVSYFKNGFADENHGVDRVLSMRDVTFALLEHMKKIQSPDKATESGMVGIGWASTGGESAAVFNERYLAADGIENCIRVLEQIDNEDIHNLDYVELNACHGGCVGGTMTVSNPYIAQARLQTLKRYLPVSPNRPSDETLPDSVLKHTTLVYSPGGPLSEDRDEALRMMSDIHQICDGLPGIDCGSCGAPTCMAFAEDIVKGETNADECTVIMRSLFHQYLTEHKKNAVMEKLKAMRQKAEDPENKP